MIIYLTDDLIDKRNSINDFYHFLFIMMLAYKEGKHFISISPKNVKLLIKDKNLKKRPELYEILKSYRTHCKSYILENFKKYFNVIIKVILDGEEECKVEDSIEYRYIKYNKFLDSVTIQKTILLGENPSDAEIYKVISDYYQKQQNLNYSSLFEARGGGGNTVVKEYEPIYNDEERFCLCILDSDKRYKEQTNYGDTADKVKKFEEQVHKKNCKMRIEILEVLELENLLPLSFYKDTYSNKIHIVNNIEKILKIDSNFKKYFDFKKGISCKYDIKKLSCKGYLKDYLCPLIKKSKVTTTNEKLLDGFQGKKTDILQDFIKQEFSYIVEKINNDSFVKPHWEKLGKLIASHILAPTKRRAI